MIRVFIISLAMLCMSFMPAFASESVDIIPKPSSLEVIPGSPFVVTPKTVIRYDEALGAQAQYLSEVLLHSTGYDLKMAEGKAGKGINIHIDSSLDKAEAYRLLVDGKSVTIKASDASGAFYGIQTLLQLLPVEVYSKSLVRGVEWTVPSVKIEDAPERPWRGMMLDVARYFFDKEFVMKYIDMMAMYKLNKLQFHFIDDSGWRLEIKKYPKLTEVGAWASTGTYPLGGYYTQDDIREIVAYAAVRGVEVIPEIEFPAHMLSAVVAYPWLSCTGEQHQVPSQHFISRDILCVGKESSFQFLRDVLEETVELFPSDYINIGGDEAVYNRWEDCPLCRKVMEENGIEKASGLQGYLTNVVADMMKEKGKTVVGWEEIIMRGKVNTPVVGLIWHEVSDTLKATQTGHKAVLTPATNMYFDFPESSTPGEQKAAMWMPPISLEKAYSMPINDYSTESTTLGVQGCFWSDQFIHGTILQELPYLNENRAESYAEYFTFPRLLALSEVAWARESERDFVDFRNRMKTHYLRLDQKECNYRVPEPIVVSEVVKDSGVEFTLESPVAGKPIRYTVNGTYPTEHSAVYSEPVVVSNRDDIKAMTVVSPGHFSLPLYFLPDYSAYKEYGVFTSSWKPAIVGEAIAKWRFECTGKVNRNGHYEVAFIQNAGSSATRLGTLKVWKREELMAEVSAEHIVTAGGKAAIYSFDITHFEAGTPFTIEIEISGQGGTDSSGYVFTRHFE